MEKQKPRQELATLKDFIFIYGRTYSLDVRIYFRKGYSTYIIQKI
jgi:hypothetical protein